MVKKNKQKNTDLFQQKKGHCMAGKEGHMNGVNFETVKEFMH